MVPGFTAEQALVHSNTAWRGRAPTRGTDGPTIVPAIYVPYPCLYPGGLVGLCWIWIPTRWG
jgi:hypothetical protein